MAASHRKVHYIPVQWLQDSRPTPAMLKAWSYTSCDGDCEIYLELRRLLKCSGRLAPSQIVADQVNKQGASEWQGCFSLVGLQLEDAILKSRKAAQYKSKLFAKAVPSERLRSEWQVSLLGAVLLLCLWSSGGRLRQKREMAKYLLHSLLARAISTSEMRGMLSPLSDLDLLQKCQQRRGIGVCVHLQRFSGKLQAFPPQVSVTHFWEEFQEVFLAMYLLQDECHSAQSIWEVLVRDLAAGIGNHLIEFGEEDVMLGQTLDPAYEDRQSVDEDVKSHLRSEAATLNKSRRSVCEVLHIADASSASRWQRQDACLYLARCWRLFQNLSPDAVVSCCFDAKRIGQPAEDLLVGVAASQDLAAWMPPQVPALAACKASCAAAAWKPHLHLPPPPPLSHGLMPLRSVVRVAGESV